MFGVDGISDFDALPSGDLRKLLLSMRKANLERLPARRPEGIFINPFERGEIGPSKPHATAAQRTEPVQFRLATDQGGFAKLSSIKL